MLAVRVLLACAAAVVWAVGVTVLQPLSEPTGPDAFAENNTYWARELRWGALLGLILVLVVHARGGPRATGLVLAGGCAWLAADVGLDRIDPAAYDVMVAIGAAMVALACCAALSFGRAEPRPRVLFTAATVAAVASGLVTGTESPTDSEPALGPGSAATGSLLALVAVVAAMDAGGSVGRRHARTLVAAGVILSATPWPLRYAWSQPTTGRGLATLAFTVLLLVFTVVALAGPRLRSGRFWADFPAVAAIAAIVLPVMLLPLVLLSVVLPVGGIFTMLAANPPIHSADSDIVTVALAIPIGLVLGTVLHSYVTGRE